MSDVSIIGLGAMGSALARALLRLGALLYEMASGRRAFQGSSRTSLIAAIVSLQPPKAIGK